jgi:hypothetical protein
LGADKDFVNLYPNFIVRWIIYAVLLDVTYNGVIIMTWEEVYSSLPVKSKMIIDIAEENRIDLTELANLQVQKQENDTHLNEVNYGIS